jgi:hypothetical protein
MTARLRMMPPKAPVAQRNLFERFKKDITKNIIDTLTSVYKAYE